MNSKGTVDVRLPDAFYKKLWCDVATIEAEERRHKGLKKTRLKLGKDGSFVPVDEEV